MGELQKTASSKSPPIYTLAENGTGIADINEYSITHLVYGKGTDKYDLESLGRMTRKKYITQKLSLPLIKMCEEIGDYIWAQKYRNAYYCQHKVFVDGNTFHGKRCKTRYCLVCLANRKADIINRYLPELQKWKNPYFVTLTVKAVSASKLRKWVDAMFRGLRQIIEKYRKRALRGKGKKLKGIRSLEANFNPIDKTYNPHWHLIVPDRETAVTLIIEWQKKWTKKYTRAFAQHKRRVGNLVDDLVEIIKYGSKIFTDPEMRKRGKARIPPMVYAAAMDNIFRAFEKRKLFGRFGFKLPPLDKAKKSSSKIIIDPDEAVFYTEHSGWLIEETGEIISGYQPTAELEFILENNVDTKVT